MQKTQKQSSLLTLVASLPLLTSCSHFFSFFSGAAEPYNAGERALNSAPLYEITLFLSFFSSKDQAYSCSSNPFLLLGKVLLAQQTVFLAVLFA